MNIKKLIPLPLAAALLALGCSSEPQPNAATEPPSSQPLPQFINLGADTCIPCRQMVPVREAIAAEYAGQLQVSFIDVRADRSAGEKYKIRVIPTQILLDAQGQEVFRHEGYWPKSEIVATLDQLKLLHSPVGRGVYRRPAQP